jgi:hypothetical protein
MEGVGEEAGRGSRSVATVMRNPERDPTVDLLGEEAADGAVWWRLKRVLGRVIRPRWRRRWSQELAGGAGDGGGEPDRQRFR